MRYRIISVGKIREPFYQAGVKEYLKRLGPFAATSLVDGLEEKINPNARDKDIVRCLQKEGERILAQLGTNEIMVVLDIHGEMLTSEGFARQMQEWNLSGKNQINLVVGGAHGLADDVKRRAQHTISLSRMTMPHQLAVLVLAEQVYRGFKIIRAEPYHK